MREPKWVPLRTALALQERSLQLFGGSSGVRDQGLLESALAKPQNVLAYEPESSLFRLAASYIYGIAKNHPFVDGNKRCAFVVGSLFLAMNVHWLAVPEAEATVMVLSIAAGEIGEGELEKWLANNSVPTAESS